VAEVAVVEAEEAAMRLVQLSKLANPDLPLKHFIYFDFLFS